MDNSSKIKLSLCMIVKNEESFLQSFLSEAKSYCDEIVIVDTGSTDSTKDIATSFGARLFDFDWIDDFSAARNFSIQQAVGEWVLVLDADERISKSHWQELRQIISESSEIAFDLPQINYVTQSNVLGFRENTLNYSEFGKFPGYTLSWLTRLFRNGQGFYFKGLVHEHLTQGDVTVDGRRISLHIHHYGQALNLDKMREKKNRYFGIGQKKALDNPHDFKAQHEAGIAAWEVQDIDRAIQFLEMARTLDEMNEANLIALGTIYQNQKSFDKARSCFQKVYEVQPHHPNILGLLGRLESDQGNLDQALELLKKQIDRNPEFELARYWLSHVYALKRKLDHNLKPTISACFIVKNEEDCLAQALECVKNHVDQIVVMDTGSTDDTVNIAMSYGAKVDTIKWKDDFAWARNQSLKRATSEWILVLDADEVVSDSDWTRIESLISRTKANQFFLVQTTYSDVSLLFNWKVNDLSEKESEGYSGYFESPLVRLFKNTPNLSFFGAVHENVRSADSSDVPVTTSIRIHHYGKHRSEERMEEKSDLYYKIGLKKLEDLPSDGHAAYEMAAQLWEMGKYEEVEPYFKRAIELSPNHKNARMLYGCFLHKQMRLADALDQFIALIQDKPDNADAHFYISSVLIDLKRYPFALEMVQKAEDLGFANKVAMYINRGVILLRLKDFDGAEKAFKNALEVNPLSQLTLLNLVLLEKDRQNHDKALEYIHKILEIDSKDSSAYKYWGEILFERRETEEALEKFLDSYKYNDQEDTVIAQVILAAYCLKREDLVAEFEHKLSELKNAPNLRIILTKLGSIYKQSKDQKALMRLQDRFSGVQMSQ